jgi:hypothetical protein
MNGKKFSVVIPVKDEYHLIPRTLPRYYRLNPDEVVICMDNPPHKKTYNLIKQISESFYIDTRILKIDRNPEYEFHQAWVRRKGFIEARNDVILNGDIDLIVNNNAYKAIEKVGVNGTGLCSLFKMYIPNSLLELERYSMRLILSIAAHIVGNLSTFRDLKKSNFTGLYALYRPYWLDSEDEGIKSLHNPKQEIRANLDLEIDDRVGMPEDSYLLECMEKKHRVEFLIDIGCISIGKMLQFHRNVQFETGRYYYLLGRNMIGTFLKSLLYLQPHHIRGYLFEMKRQKDR